MLFAVFGPVFIDRSISYHMAFYAVEKGSINVDEIRGVFSNDIFQKRINDAIASGMLESDGNGLLKSTSKAQWMYMVMEPLGDITGSMSTYNKMKEEVENNHAPVGK